VVLVCISVLWNEFFLIDDVIKDFYIMGDLLLVDCVEVMIVGFEYVMYYWISDEINVFVEFVCKWVVVEVVLVFVMVC